MRSGFGAFIVKRLPVAAAVYALAGGAVSAMGLVLQIMRLTDWWNTGITMKFNTTVCAMAAGTALLVSLVRPRQKAAIRALAGISLLIGGLSLLQHLTGLNFGIDTLIINELPGSPGTASPGRMGPPASIAFILISTALILGTFRRTWRRTGGWCAMFVVALSALPLVGYLYGANQLYAFSQVTGVALQTATMIAALAIGIVLSRPELGISPMFTGEDGGSVMFRRLVIPVIFVSFGLGYFRLMGQQMGLYDTAFGTALRTLVEIALLLWLLWWAANGVSRAEEALRQADRRKDEFIATLSHELRNPLAPISNAVQVLDQEGSQEPKLVAARRMIERQVAHMVRLIDDLLDVSRITRNKLEIRKAPVELGLVLRQAIETSDPVIAAHGHSLTVHLPEKAVYLDADAARLLQVFSNLLNNACKFTPAPGSIVLTASAVDNGRVSVTVGDNGIGISPEKVASVFEMFTQADGLADASQTGLGIGLTLARQIVELHGGRIDATSAGSGQGSEFVVTLPVSARDYSAEFAPVEVTGTVEKIAPKPRKRRMLVVDDNIDSAESMSMLMTLEGNETIVAYDGPEAIVRANEFRPDIMLLDIGLPGMDGYEVCRAIRSETWGSEILIIAMTGWGQDGDRRRSKEAGFDVHLVKPVDPDELIKLLASRK